MNVQQPPRHVVHQLMDQIDRVTGNDQPVATREMPPSYGGPQRDAIASVVDGLVSDICTKIGALRETLDDIEKAVLSSAGRSKHALNEHVATCVRINDEIVHMRAVIADLAEQARDT